MIIQSRGALSKDKFWGLHRDINVHVRCCAFPIKLSGLLAILWHMNSFLCSNATNKLCATTTTTETRKINKQNKNSECAAH